MPREKKPVLTEDILSSLIEKEVEDLLAIQKKCAELISQQEKDAEAKLLLIRNGGK